MKKLNDTQMENLSGGRYALPMFPAGEGPCPEALLWFHYWGGRISLSSLIQQHC